MHEHLWAGIELKLQHARFFLDEMGKALLPPPRTPMSVALESSGAIATTAWQHEFYPLFDAFLAMARSIPELVSACFGADQGSKEMKTWFRALVTAEQTRRKKFSAAFEPFHAAFRALPLSTARNISLHRSGIAPVEVNITGRFGVSYTGTPVEHIPSSEIRQSAPGDPLQWLDQSVPLRPNWQDFQINGKPLFA